MNGEPKLNANSYIGIGLTITLITASWILNDKLNGIIRVNDKLDVRLSEMEKRRERPDPWTGTDMLRWTVEFGQLNPVLKTPEPRHFRE